MRLFVAVELEAGVASAAVALTDELRRRVSRLAPAARITWIPEDRLHLTVRFIGAADDEAAGAIHAALDDPLDTPRFPLTLAGAGAFPPRGAPRVLWAGLEEGRDSLEQVEREVTRRLSAAGIAPDARPYRPHLTLARVREAAGLSAANLFTGIGPIRLGTMQVEAITLFESRLSPKGPAYIALQRTALQH